MTVDMFGGAPTTCSVDALGFAIRWIRRHGKTPFSPEAVIAAAAKAGVTFQNQRQWGPIFRQLMRDGYIRRAGLFSRASSNHSVRPGWVGV